jgi:hypothetical protein
LQDKGSTGVTQQIRSALLDHNVSLAVGPVESDHGSGGVSEPEPIRSGDALDKPRAKHRITRWRRIILACRCAGV